MKLLMLRSMWSAPPRLATMIAQTVDGGFDGVEGPIPRDAAERAALRTALLDHDLCFIAEATTGVRPPHPTGADWWVPHPDATPDDHLADLKWTLDHAPEMGARCVSTMTGYDAWSFAQQLDFFGRAVELESVAGVAVGFETHRCRSLFNPWVARDLLLQLPALKLTCDLSHWCVVCERLIHTERDVLRLVAERALHVQCRVGYAQHAQVNDPFAPEHAAAVAAHEQWWDMIWDAQQARGVATTTMTAEWGAEGYMQQLPHTCAPVADLWDMTRRFAQRQRERFALRV